MFITFILTFTDPPTFLSLSLSLSLIKSTISCFGPVWDFERMDGFPFNGVSDAPLPDEMLVMLALSGSTRPFHRIGAGAPPDFLVPKPE